MPDLLTDEAAWLAAPHGDLPALVAPDGPLVAVEAGVRRAGQLDRYAALTLSRSMIAHQAKNGPWVQSDTLAAWVLWGAPGGQAAGVVDQVALADVVERMVERLTSLAYGRRFRTVESIEVGWPDATGLITWRDIPGGVGAGYAVGVRWTVTRERVAA